VVSAVEKVLLVDDDEDLRAAVGECLLAAGARACLSMASLAELQAHEADVLRSGLAILDVNLGDGLPSGIDVFHWLRDHGYAAPIVFLTGHASSDPRVAAAGSMPNTRVRLKPVSIETLVELLQQ
jgi:FixJ family two-component response regulator